MRTSKGYEFTIVARTATYTPVARDAGLLLTCDALGSGPGGRALAPVAPESSVRVGR